MQAKISVVCQKQSNGSYFAICPEIQGCYTQGDTYEESLSNLRELVELTLSEETDQQLINEIATEKFYIFSEMAIEI
ncbi:MAG: type II toxin-antitoxin system HicB family antitoxin [Clostridiales bacterium]|jgi:predicted RNase H-like HicB family nuclease|nr:type II toxin-antitoxin system HicB family antitoxin [Clostridiales bacterium]